MFFSKHFMVRYLLGTPILMYVINSSILTFYTDVSHGKFGKQLVPTLRNKQIYLFSLEMGEVQN